MTPKKAGLPLSKAVLSESGREELEKLLDREDAKIPSRIVGFAKEIKNNGKCLEVKCLFGDNAKYFEEIDTIEQFFVYKMHNPDFNSKIDSILVIDDKFLQALEKDENSSYKRRIQFLKDQGLKVLKVDDVINQIGQDTDLEEGDLNALRQELENDGAYLNDFIRGIMPIYAKSLGYKRLISTDIDIALSGSKVENYLNDLERLDIPAYREMPIFYSEGNFSTALLQKLKLDKDQQGNNKQYLLDLAIFHLGELEKSKEAFSVFCPTSNGLKKELDLANLRYNIDEKETIHEIDLGEGNKTEFYLKDTKQLARFIKINKNNLVAHFPEHKKEIEDILLNGATDFIRTQNIPTFHGITNRSIAQYSSVREQQLFFDKEMVRYLVKSCETLGDINQDIYYIALQREAVTKGNIGFDLSGQGLEDLSLQLMGMGRIIQDKVKMRKIEDLLENVENHYAGLGPVVIFNHDLTNTTVRGENFSDTYNAEAPKKEDSTLLMAGGVIGFICVVATCLLVRSCCKRRKHEKLASSEETPSGRAAVTGLEQVMGRPTAIRE